MSEQETQRSGQDAAEALAKPRRTRTTAEKANRLFHQLIQNAPGVVHVEPYGGEAIGEQSFRVYVRDGDLDAETGVYQAKGRVYDRFPNAELDVEVLEQSDLIEDSLQGVIVNG